MSPRNRAKVVDCWWSEFRDSPDKANCLVIRQAIPIHCVSRITYLRDCVMTNERAAWQPIAFGARDFWWRNDDYDGSTVKANFCQVNFFPWNEGGAEVISILQHIFELRNILNGLPAQSFLEVKQGDAFSARVAAQHYSIGKGWMEAHVDPVDHHQNVLASIVLSEHGNHYQGGGLFLQSSDGTKCYPERKLKCGDAVLFHPQTVHGVDPMSECEDNETGRTGRWMLLCATNALQPRQVELSRPLSTTWGEDAGS